MRHFVHRGEIFPEQNRGVNDGLARRLILLDLGAEREPAQIAKVFTIAMVAISAADIVKKNTN